MLSITPELAVETNNLVLTPSDWITIDQELVNAFADITQDHQFIHVDPIKASKETELPGTIAHGFLTLSLLSHLARNSMPTFEGANAVLNYGMDNLRFLAPVLSGSQVRAHFTLKEAKFKDPTKLLVRYEVNLEIKEQKTPALVCEWLTLVQLAT